MKNKIQQMKDNYVAEQRLKQDSVNKKSTMDKNKAKTSNNYQFEDIISPITGKDTKAAFKKYVGKGEEFKFTKQPAEVTETKPTLPERDADDYLKNQNHNTMSSNSANNNENLNFDADETTQYDAQDIGLFNKIKK